MKSAPYYTGNAFYVNVYKQYDDIRLVFAPPQSLGKFGGETDNWMWPRQTCDFSVFAFMPTRTTSLPNTVRTTAR